VDTALTALIVIGILILTVVTLSERYFSAQDAIMESWQEAEERAVERARTDISPVSAETTPLGNGVRIKLRNEGDAKLADFDRWDVILRYTGVDGYHAEWYPHNSGVKQWTNTIYENFEPGILNPEEEMLIEVWFPLSSAVSSPTTNTVVIATPNGITASTVFTH